MKGAPPLARGLTLPAITPGVTQIAPAATQGEVYGLALLALPPQAAAVEWPPGLGVAFPDRAQRQRSAAPKQPTNFKSQNGEQIKTGEQMGEQIAIYPPSS